MNPSSDRVLRYLTGNENIEDISVNDLQKLADENPYFPVARFLLAKKLKAVNNSHFLPEVQKTALYFSNPFWLNYQLADPSEYELLPVEENFFSEAQIVPSLPLTELAEHKEAFKSSSDETIENSHLETTSGNAEKTDQPEEEMAAITREPDFEAEQFLEEAASTEETFIPDNVEAVLIEPQTAAGLETMEVLEEMAGASRQTDESAEKFLNEVSKSAEETAEQKLPETEIFDFSLADNKENNDITQEKENKDDETAEQDEHEIMFQNIKAMLDATSDEADADTENTLIPIDPYYTIDYFASQGIKLDLDQNPKDELGQHLKKFTHWLRHMKKLGPEDATEVIARTETDADIQKIAESSNTAREVVTEAMASVLEKQGKKDKAVELYNKLSFLNPDKRAYFAGKIKNLKGS